MCDVLAIADITPKAEFAPYEIASAFTWTRQAAAVQLDLAYAIVRRLPAVHAAMAAGDIDLPKARVIVDGVAALDAGAGPHHRGADPAAGARSDHRRAAPRLAKLVIDADPDAAAKRHKAKVADRRVELQPTEDSCANLLGLNLPAEEALAASNRITAMARALKRAGDPRSMDQLRADTFLDLLMGSTASPACGWCGAGRHAGNVDPPGQPARAPGRLRPGHRRHRPPGRRTATPLAVDVHHP